MIKNLKTKLFRELGVYQDLADLLMTPDDDLEGICFFIGDLYDEKLITREEVREIGAVIELFEPGSMIEAHRAGHQYLYWGAQIDEDRSGLTDFRVLLLCFISEILKDK